MLKAYDYAEPQENVPEIQNQELFRMEKAVAIDYVLNHPNKKERCTCPVCGSAHTGFVFSRWDESYYLCEECFSIYLPIDPPTLKEYLALDKMKELRTTKEYQKQAEYRRGGIWDEFIMWAQYRVYRYLGKNSGLDVIDYGNRYAGSVDRIRYSGLCAHYELRDSILPLKTEKVKNADIIFYMNQLQHEIRPAETLRELRTHLKDDGILILNTRLGSGFDVLTLKGNMDSIFPYEHIFLPSAKGLEMILDEAGYELLEITTPGTRDMESVLRNQNKIEDNNLFVRYLLKTADRSILSDLQQFLQKSGLSSFAQVVAKARK